MASTNSPLSRTRTLAQLLEVFEYRGNLNIAKYGGSAQSQCHRPVGQHGTEHAEFLLVVAGSAVSP
jgi:hypothetical protein